MPTPYELAFVLKEVSLTRHDLEYGYCQNVSWHVCVCCCF